MKNAEYWRGRFSILEEAAQRGADRYISDLEKVYRAAEQGVQKDLEAWYGRFAANNGISLTDARKMLTTGQLKEFHWSVEQYIKIAQQENLSPEWIKKLENASARFHISRLESLQLQIQQQAELLYGNQLDGLDSLLKDVISNGYNHTAFEIQKGLGLGWDITALDQKKLEKLLSRPWTADGKTFRDRCWENKANLVSGIQSTLTQGILRGQGLQKITDAIQKQFGVSRYKAGRLAHTETTYFNAISAKETYGELSVEQVEILETLDSSTCDICADFDGTVIPLSQFEPGVTVPPFHPNCRGTTCPHFSDMDGQRAARNEDGEVYYVPANMDYKAWEAAFVNGGAKDGLTPATDTAIIERKARIQSIMDQNNAFLSDAQKAEFQAILENMDDSQLNLYQKMGANFGDNLYHQKGGAAYWPGQHRVKMDIDSFPWEKSAGTGQVGAWSTKFHEECHQLDHLLGLNQTKFAQSASGTLPGLTCTKITDVRSVTGEKLIQAIENDIVSVINRAVDERNAARVALDLDPCIKRITSLKRIPADTKDSLIYWLKDNFQTPQDRAHIDLFTDAVGLATENRICPYKAGFWGHDGRYNKDRGRSGATSETFATFGALFFGKNPESVAVIKDLMPSTWNAYSELFTEIMEYAATHDILYP